MTIWFFIAILGWFSLFSSQLLTIFDVLKGSFYFLSQCFFKLSLALLPNQPILIYSAILSAKDFQKELKSSRQSLAYYFLLIWFLSLGNFMKLQIFLFLNLTNLPLTPSHHLHHLKENDSLEHSHLPFIFLLIFTKWSFLFK